MKRSFSRSWSVAVLTAITTFLVLPAVASAADFVLTASHWGKKQNSAVAAAGGTVNWSHAKAGIASVSSDDADFLATVGGDNSFKSAAEDMMVQWQDPAPIEFGHIDPNNEFFYAQGYQWNMEAIEAPAAWAADCTGAGVRIAIIAGRSPRGVRLWLRSRESTSHPYVATMSNPSNPPLERPRVG